MYNNNPRGIHCRASPVENMIRRVREPQWSHSGGQGDRERQLPGLPFIKPKVGRLGGGLWDGGCSWPKGVGWMTGCAAAGQRGCLGCQPQKGTQSSLDIDIAEAQRTQRQRSRGIWHTKGLGLPLGTLIGTGPNSQPLARLSAAWDGDKCKRSGVPGGCIKGALTAAATTAEAATATAPLGCSIRPVSVVGCGMWRLWSATKIRN